MTINEKRNMWKNEIAASGVDTDKDYFALSFSERDIVKAIMNKYNYKGTHSFKSRLQMFWYSMQCAK